jgi:hypothetical protein
MRVWLEYQEVGVGLFVMVPESRYRAHIDVPEAQAARWQEADQAFWAAQEEMEAAIKDARRAG